MIHQLEALPRWQRRVIAVGAVLALALFVSSALVLPVASAIQGHLEWRRGALEQIVHFRGLSSRRAQFEAMRMKLSDDPSRRMFYPVQSTSAQLQSELGQFYDPQKVTVQALEPLEPIVENGLSRIGVRVALTADMEQLALLLGRIAAAPRLISIEAMTISGPAYQERGKNAPLVIRMDLRAYLQPQEDKP